MGAGNCQHVQGSNVGSALGVITSLRRAVAAGAATLAAILASTVPVPAANAVERDDFSINGPAYVGSGLSVSGAYEYFSPVTRTRSTVTQSSGFATESR